MISQQEELQELFAQGCEQTRKTSQSVLVSQLTRVTYRDPLSFFAAGARLFGGERIYWSVPGQDLVLVGLGTAYAFEREQGNFYSETEQAWQSLLERNIVDPQPSMPETGPVLLGGFSFDPLQQRTRLWSAFPDTKMVLPKYMLTVKGKETWLTTNSVIQPDHDLYDELKRIGAEQDQLLSCESAVDMPKEPVFFDLEEKNVHQWLDAVKKVANDIRNGALEKVVLAREVHLQLSANIAPEQVLNRLRDEQLDSYIFAVESGEHCFLGASPERLVKKQGNTLLSSCIAGSIRRGETAEEDDHLGMQLLQDEKNRLEHEVVVHMIKEAMTEACELVYAPTQPELYKTKDIQHLYTPVQGWTSQNTSLLTVVEKLSPTPALGGYPCQPALARIRQTERFDRGKYAAPIGWINDRGDGEFAVAIRSGLLKNSEAVLFAGCGIVADSDPMSEFEETRMKLQPMLSALGGLRS